MIIIHKKKLTNSIISKKLNQKKEASYTKTTRIMNCVLLCGLNFTSNLMCNNSIIFFKLTTSSCEWYRIVI